MRRLAPTLLVTFVAALMLVVATPAQAGPPYATTPTEASITFEQRQIATGAAVIGTMTVLIPDGFPLDGKIEGSMIAADYTTTILFRVPVVGTAKLILPFSRVMTQAGDFRFHVQYTPTKATITGAASADATLVVRTVGASMDWSPSPVSTSAGGSASVRITLPNATDAVGGEAHLQVGTLGDVAVCSPTRTSATAAGCTLKIPSGLPTGSQPMNLSWQGSPVFQDLNYTGTLTVTKGTTSGSGTSNTSGGAGSTAGSPVSATPSPATTGSPTPTPTSTGGAYAGSDSGPSSEDGSSATSSDGSAPGGPDVAALAIAASLIALLLAGAGVLVWVIVRRSRAGHTA